MNLKVGDVIPKIDDDIVIEGYKLFWELGVQFTEVLNFCVGSNNLVTLKGSPKRCSEFKCSRNPNLKSFEYAPKYMNKFEGEYLNVNSFKGLENSQITKRINVSGSEITSFDGLNPDFKGELELSNTLITSFEGCPKGVSSLVLERCDTLKSIKGCPPNLKWLFLGNSWITSLEGLPREMDYLAIPYAKGLTSMVGGPRKVGILNVNGSKFKTMEGFPEIVEENLYMSSVNLDSFDAKYFPKGIKGKLKCAYTFGKFFRDEDGFTHDRSVVVRELRKILGIQGEIIA